MLERRADRWQAGLLAVSLLIGLWAWAQLPADAQVPIHFNVRGEADGWASPGMGLLLLPLIAALMWGLRPVLDKLQPQPDPALGKRQADALDQIFLAIAGLMTAVQLIIVAVALTSWRPVAAHFLIPVGLVLLVVGRASLRLVDPRDPQLARSARALPVLRWAGPASLVLVFGAMAYPSLDADAPWPPVMLAGIGLLLMVTGNVMGKLRPNASVGIRTRWTLANTRVWDQTHRFGGKAQVLAGAVLLGLAFTPLPPPWHGPVIALVVSGAAGAAVLQSYRLWRALPPESPGEDRKIPGDA